MNEIISIKERISIFLVGPRGSGKPIVICVVEAGSFQPVFDKAFYFYSHYQPLYSQMQKKTLNLSSE